jgi:tetratricopeptide (TPR) repeat protein
MNQSKYDEATQAFVKAVELNPQYVEAWAGKGWAFYGGGRYSEAVRAYDKATELNPTYADAWAGKGFALLALGWGDRLLNEMPFDKAIELDPNYGLAWIGELFSDGSHVGDPQFEEALAAAVRLNPRYVATILGPGEYRETFNFKREVFLKEGCPRTSKAIVATVPPPRKMVAMRFAKLKNVTK